jgi:transcriptional regulator
VIYRPSAFAKDDRQELESFIRAFPFATVVTTTGTEPWISHVPLRLEGDRLLGHLARGNGHAKALEGAPTLAVFHGPHAYISPRWYESGPAVPTWNYMVVHAAGPARLLSDADTAALMARLSGDYETQDWSYDALPEDYRGKMQTGIVGFALTIERLEGKFKLSQNKGAADQARVAEALAQGSPEDQAVAAFMRPEAFR